MDDFKVVDKYQEYEHDVIRENVNYDQIEVRKIVGEDYGYIFWIHLMFKTMPQVVSPYTDQIVDRYQVEHYLGFRTSEDAIAYAKSVLAWHKLEDNDA